MCSIKNRETAAPHNTDAIGTTMHILITVSARTMIPERRLGSGEENRGKFIIRPVKKKDTPKDKIPQIKIANHPKEGSKEFTIQNHITTSTIIVVIKRIRLRVFFCTLRPFFSFWLWVL